MHMGCICRPSVKGGGSGVLPACRMAPADMRECPRSRTPQRRSSDEPFGWVRDFPGQNERVREDLFIVDAFLMYYLPAVVRFHQPFASPFSV